MARSPREFGNLVKGALREIKGQTGKNISILEHELSEAVNCTVSAIQHWKRGNCPGDSNQAIKAAQWFWKNKGLTSKEEFELFLDYAGHPSPATVSSTLFARVDKPQVETGELENFIGREEKIKEVFRALRLRETVVLWGPGGVGKTLLVRTVIEKLAPDDTAPNQFPHGILYYEFADNAYTADDIFRYIARFFDVEVIRGEPPRDAAIQALRNKKALIILDNAEVTDELSRVQNIRQQCGMLIVSRHRYFNLASKIIHLDTLSTNEARAVLRAWSTDNKNQSGFQVWIEDGTDNDKIADEICEEVGKLPLALRLAGKHMLRSRITPAEFQDRWQEWGLSLLQTKGNHQHDSIEILFEMSLEQASKDAREIIAVAGRLADQPFTLEVIAAGLEKSPDVIHKLIQDLWEFSLARQVSDERWQVIHRLI